MILPKIISGNYGFMWNLKKESNNNNDKKEKRKKRKNKKLQCPFCCKEIKINMNKHIFIQCKLLNKNQTENINKKISINHIINIIDVLFKYNIDLNKTKIKKIDENIKDKIKKDLLLKNLKQGLISSTYILGMGVPGTPIFPFLLPFPFPLPF